MTRTIDLKLVWAWWVLALAAWRTCESLSSAVIRRSPNLALTDNIMLPPSLVLKSLPSLAIKTFPGQEVSQSAARAAL